MRITALAGGVGGARFLRGLRHHLDTHGPQNATITVIANTGDDITFHGLRICPDLDTLLYTLAGAVDEQGWGRAGDTHRVQSDLAAYGVQPQWFALGDLDIATHLARSHWLAEGLSLSQVTARLCDRWGLPDQGIELLPMCDTPAETHVVLDDESQTGEQVIHFQDWWVRQRAVPRARRFVVPGLDSAVAAPGVLDAIHDADLVVLPPSNPVVSIGTVLGVLGVRQALVDTSASVVGVSPIISGRPVRGYADRCLDTLGVDATAAAVGGLYEDFLDAWLVDPADAATTTLQTARVESYDRPLLMTDVHAAARIAAHVLRLGTSANV